MCKVGLLLCGILRWVAVQTGWGTSDYVGGEAGREKGRREEERAQRAIKKERERGR